MGVIKRDGQPVAGKKIQINWKKMKQYDNDRKKANDFIKKPEHVWDKAYELDIKASNLPNGNCCMGKDLVDKSCNYFVLKLNEIGIKTYLSCEGHLEKLEWDDRQEKFVLPEGTKARLYIGVSQGLDDAKLAILRILADASNMEINKKDVVGYTISSKYYRSAEERAELCRSMADNWELALKRCLEN